MPPTGIRTATRNRMRSNAQSLMPDLGTIKGHNAARAFVTLSSNVPYRIEDPQTPDFKIAAEMEVVTTFYVLKIPVTYALSVGNHFFGADGKGWIVFKVFDQGSPLIQKRAYIQQSDQLT